MFFERVSEVDVFLSSFLLTSFSMFNIFFVFTSTVSILALQPRPVSSSQRTEVLSLITFSFSFNFSTSLHFLVFYIFFISFISLFILSFLYHFLIIFHFLSLMFEPHTIHVHTCTTLVVNHSRTLSHDVLHSPLVSSKRSYLARRTQSRYTAIMVAERC